MGLRSRRAWAGGPKAEPSTTEILILATAESRWQAWQNDDGRRTASARRVRPRRRETRPLREAGFRGIDPGGHSETRVLGRDTGSSSRGRRSEAVQLDAVDRAAGGLDGHQGRTAGTDAQAGERDRGVA